MGVVNHNVVIATTWNREIIEDFELWIKTLKPDYQDLFSIIYSHYNNNATIVLGPDGSKEGLKESYVGDRLRIAFITQIEKFNYEDGSSPFDWVEVGYGEFGQKVLKGNCTNKYTDDEYYSGR